MRKTKKQKLKLDLRKESVISSDQFINSKPNQLKVNFEEVGVKLKTFEKPDFGNENIVNNKENDYSFIVSDLKKLIVLAGIAISAQIVLYLTLV